MSKISISKLRRGEKLILLALVLLLAGGVIWFLSETLWSNVLEEAKLARMQSKARELGRLCAAYKDGHGQYPRDFQQLAAAGLISNFRLKYLLWINDWSGYGKTREWAYGPDDDGVLFCASKPVREPISSVSGLMVFVAYENGHAVSLQCGQLPEYVHCDPIREIGGKGYRLGLLCVAYSETHHGHYPAEFKLLVESGLASGDKLKRLLSIQDASGPWTDRKWIYTPDNPEILFYTSQPVRSGRNGTGDVWLIYKPDAGLEPVHKDSLPAAIKESLVP